MARSARLIMPVAVIVILILSVVSGCSSSGTNQTKEKAEGGAKPAAQSTQEATEKPKELKKIVIANPAKALVFLPVYFGVDKGFYKEEGLDVEVMNVKADVLISGMTAGEIDYATSAGSVLRAAVQGLPVRMLMYMALKPDFTLISQPEINSVADLKGKVVASSSAAATSTVSLLRTLKHFNVDPSEVTIQYIAGSQERIAALKSRAIDAAVLTMPFEITAAEMGLKELFFSGGIMDIPFSGIGTTKEKISKETDEVKAVLRATMKSMKYIQDPANRGEVEKFIASYWKISEEGGGQVLDKLLKITSSDGFAPDSSVQNDIDTARQELKLGQGTINVSDVVDYTLLKEVQVELGAK